MDNETNNSDFSELERSLSSSLQTYDWVMAESICTELINKIDTSSEPFSSQNAKRILNSLRRKRRFNMMSGVAEAIMRSGQRDAQIKRQYAQSLIDTGLLSAAELVVREIENDPGVSQGEKLEAIGLAGRIYKQQFVNLDNSREQDYLRRSIAEYLRGYEQNPDSYWHSINAVALVMRGERDGIDVKTSVDAKSLAADIHSLFTTKEEQSSELLRAWEYATKMEAEIALGRFEEAYSTSLSYISSPDTDAFEINSTLRQLVEIWQLNDQEPPGNNILPTLRAAILDREGGSIRLTSGEAIKESINLEGVFSDNAPKTLKWYKQGLERTNSIARIELADGKGIGTAGLFNGRDFFPDIDEVLLVTNSHVVSRNPADSGLPPNKVRANIQGSDEVFEIDRVVWSSAQTDLDVSFLALKGQPEAPPLPVSQTPAEMSDPAPRVYIIGHPNGRDLEVSLNDNRMVASNERFVHYRTPTEPGSSGSPVFDQYGWEVVAVHHGGSDNLPRIDGVPGTYQANEGISMRAVKNAISADR